MRDPVGVRVAGRVAAHGQHVADPGVGVLADDVAQLGDGVVDGGEVGHRGQRGVGDDLLGLADRAGARGAAGA